MNVGSLIHREIKKWFETLVLTHIYCLLLIVNHVNRDNLHLEWISSALNVEILFRPLECILPTSNHPRCPVGPFKFETFNQRGSKKPKNPRFRRLSHEIDIRVLFWPFSLVCSSNKFRGFIRTMSVDFASVWFDLGVFLQWKARSLLPQNIFNM